MLRRACAAITVVVVGCHRGEPPVALGIDGSVAPLPLPPMASATSTDPPPAASAGGVTRTAAAEPPRDAGIDPGTLPQTRDKPEASGPAFEGRVAALWDAIVKDDPELAMSSFFPVTAYEQVKAITNASSDWRRRLVAAFKRDIHALHKRIAEHAGDAKLLRAEVPSDRARWVEPNEESNKLGYYRVYGTRLLYEVDGKERSLEVTSLISWRGEWYVVHLTGFK